MSIPAAERKTALSLFPYFNQKHPVIIDVGSNKGDWSQVLIRNVEEAHLFEPNEIFLHYSMVCFCDVPHAHFSSDALSNAIGFTEFTYFSNENNGLSNIIGNDKWKDLPFKKKIVNTDTLDDYCDRHLIDTIDFLKLDVEGAELMVLQGGRHLLKDQVIKFIQIEYAEHIEVTGRNFSDIVEYLAKFGYKPIKTEDKENVVFAMVEFTQDWNKEFIKNTQGLKVDFALEIGCFEGLTSRYICDNLLNAGGRMICVDPLTDEYLPGHPDNNLFVGQYERFVRNTKGYPIELMRMKSEDAYLSQGFQDYRFQLIYIDGDHSERAVYSDGVRAFNVCAVGGIIIFDDYEWREETKRGINQFLSEFMAFIEVQHKGYQVVIKKTNE